MPERIVLKSYRLSSEKDPIPQQKLNRAKRAVKPPAPKGYVPGRKLEEWREWKMPGVMEIGTRQAQPLINPEGERPKEASALDFEACNDWLARKMCEEGVEPGSEEDMVLFVEDLAFRLKAERFRFRDSFDKLTRKQQRDYIRELLRPGGMLVLENDQLLAVATQMAGHIVNPDGTVPHVTHEGARDLMQICCELMGLAKNLDQLCVEVPEEEIEEEIDLMGPAESFQTEAQASGYARKYKALDLDGTGDDADGGAVAPPEPMKPDLKNSEWADRREWLRLYQAIADTIANLFRDCAEKALSSACEDGDLKFVRWWHSARNYAEFQAAIPNKLQETTVVSALHRAVLFDQLEIVRCIIQSNVEAAPHLAVTLDGTALHLAAWRGNPQVIGLLIGAGCDINASSSHVDIEDFGMFKMSRTLLQTSVVDVPWKYKQKTQEFSPLDIFNDFCEYQHQGSYAGLSQSKLLLEGHGGLRHGVQDLAYSMVYYTQDGGQLPVDTEKEKLRKERALQEV